MKNPSIQTVVLLGAGNVAWHLQRAFEEAGIAVKQQWRRGETLCREADLYLLCVPDDAIEDLLPLLPPDAYWAHTSACAAANLSPRGGVFYPLQTFTKGLPLSFREIPFFVEAPDDSWCALLQELARKLSPQVFLSTPQQRLALHTAAVFACNFTNHLLAKAEEILEKESLNPALLHPLIRQTFEKALLFPPAQVQTGPARRGDLRTQQRHLQNLNPLDKEIYIRLSESIREKYKAES